MKAKLETSELKYRGVALLSETPEEKAVLESIWSGHGRAVMITRLNDQVKLSLAPTPQGVEVDNEDLADER